jgi:hypothetical protein
MQTNTKIKQIKKQEELKMVIRKKDMELKRLAFSEMDPLSVSRRSGSSSARGQ